MYTFPETFPSVLDLAMPLVLLSARMRMICCLFIYLGVGAVQACLCWFMNQLLSLLMVYYHTTISDQMVLDLLYANMVQHVEMTHLIVYFHLTLHNHYLPYKGPRKIVF